ncbi:hypothetical protein JHK82_021964 [Glycine max]|nr:hypothetical protein JHK85_022432 [Glycine max]KAG5026065.1 hypothetical protein JHK86_021979 [Glycine max]KAG5137233.1 hypothetical protein JHK82_021964 [Glycine max]
MGSEATLKLPVIDFTNLKLEANNPNWEAVKSQVHKALVDYGCFEAIFDKVPLELRKAIFAALQELFDLPLQTKILNVSKKPYHGYVGQYPMAWSNGRLHSPFHRVIMSGNEARYSAGLFSIPKGGSIIKAPEELVDEEHPLLFKPFDHVEFLKSYYTEQGQRDQSALRTYCGV